MYCTWKKKCSGRPNPNTLLSGGIIFSKRVINEKTETVIQSGIYIEMQTLRSQFSLNVELVY